MCLLRLGDTTAHRTTQRTTGRSLRLAGVLCSPLLGDKALLAWGKMSLCLWGGGTRLSQPCPPSCPGAAGVSRGCTVLARSRLWSLVQGWPHAPLLTPAQMGADPSQGRARAAEMAQLPPPELAAASMGMG